MRTVFSNGSSLQPLSSLAAGAQGVVSAVSASNPELLEKLLVMGIVPGVRVEVLQQAPLGGPLRIRLRGYCLSLRRAEASLVRVTAE